MRQYERSGVHVDQCTECRGIFLDRGELEKLVDAEASWNSAQAAPPSPAPVPAPSRPQPGYQPQPYQSGYDQRYDSHHDQHHGYGHKKKRKSFFEDLFD